MSSGSVNDKLRSSVTSSPEKNAIVEIHKPQNVSQTESSPSSTSSKRRKDTKTDRPRKSSKGDDGLAEDVQNSSNGSERFSRAQKIRESWMQSDLNGSAEEELQIHTQIKQGIMGFIEKEIKKSDAKHPIATLSAYVNSITESEENLRNVKGSSHGSGSHREKKSPSRRKKKKISSKHRSDLGSDFDITISSMSALEKVDDYLKEYNKCEEVTLSGELEIETNDLVNNNEYNKESKLKPRKRRKSKHDESKRDKNANRDVSPRVFDPHTSKHSKSSDNIKPVRPALDLTSMLDDLGSDIVSYNERHIDNPFSSPSPMTSPNEVLGAFGSRPDKIYVQKGGTFRAVARDRVLGDGHRRGQDKNYFRISSLTPLDVAITAQSGWRGVATLCHGLLGGLALMHLLALSYSDASQPGHLTFHASIIVPYSAAYYFLCACCLVSVFDSLDPSGFTHAVNYYPHVRGVCLAFLYVFCMILTLASRKYDEMIAFQYEADTNATNVTSVNSTAQIIPVPEFYTAWSHLSIWRALLPILAAMVVAFIRQDDVLYRELANLTQFKHSLQSIGG